MSSFYMKLMFVLMIAMLAAPTKVPGQSQAKSNADPLKPYTTCKLPGDLKVKEVTRRPKSMEKYREVTTAKGRERVSVADGYRVMFAYQDLLYFYANVKIEQSALDSYPQDKERVINDLKHIASTETVSKTIYSDKTVLNGFEHYGIDRDVIDVGGTIGIHVLFFDADHLIVTIYLLNQDDKNSASVLLGGHRRFHNTAEYGTLKDDFLNRYSECLKGVAKQP